MTSAKKPVVKASCTEAVILLRGPENIIVTGKVEFQGPIYCKAWGPQLPSAPSYYWGWPCCVLWSIVFMKMQFFSLKMSAKSFSIVGFTGSSSEWEAYWIWWKLLKKWDNGKHVYIIKEREHISMLWICENNSILHHFI